MSRLISQEKHFAELDFDDKTASSCLANNLEKHINTKISKRLTLIITTSPIPSAPSTILLSTVLDSFQTHCASLLECNVVVVFDAHEPVTTEKPRLKKGRTTQQGVEDYDGYKQNCRQLLLQTFADTNTELTLARSTGEAEFGSPNSTTPVAFTIDRTADNRITFIDVVGRRLGFGLAVRTALRQVETSYVCVHQHDWALCHSIPLERLLDAMDASSAAGLEEKPIKYICMASGRQLSYATSEQVIAFPKLLKLSLELTNVYAADSIPLTPMFFWHDKPHIASTTHYLERVFPSRFAMPRGAFIEDTIGQKARNQMKQGQWAKWATWMYNPGDGKQICLRHLQGRTWNGEFRQQRTPPDIEPREF